MGILLNQSMRPMSRMKICNGGVMRVTATCCSSTFKGSLGFPSFFEMLLCLEYIEVTRQLLKFIRNLLNILAL